MHTLPDLFTERDFAVAELAALRLEGAIVPNGDGYSPGDEPDSPHRRLAGIGVLADLRLVADRMTACWAMGLVERPARLTLAARIGSGLRPSRVPGGHEVREVVIDETELLGTSRRWTTPLRTLLDLARIGPHPGAPILQALARAAGVDRAEAIALVEARRHLPDKRRTIEVLRRGLAGLSSG